MRIDDQGMLDANPTTTDRPHWVTRAYLAWFASDTAKGLAAAIAAFAIPLMALAITDDPVLAGVLGAVGIATRVVAAVIGGQLADLVRRIVIVIHGTAVGAALDIAFTAAALTGTLDFTVLLILHALLAARAGLFDLAGEALLNDLVPTQHSAARKPRTALGTQRSSSRAGRLVDCCSRSVDGWSGS